MTIATIDRLVHHATIFEMNVESFRRRTAIQQRQPATSNLEASDIASTDQNIDIETKMSHNDIDQRHRS
ncbi:hypothetical protein GR247_40990 [Rhizobium leguminosarum]|nr:hypothetical protein [Rhizobium leguminosarum]